VGSFAAAAALSAHQRANLESQFIQRLLCAPPLRRSARLAPAGADCLKQPLKLFRRELAECVVSRDMCEYAFCELF